MTAVILVHNPPLFIPERLTDRMVSDHPDVTAIIPRNVNSVLVVKQQRRFMQGTLFQESSAIRHLHSNAEPFGWDGEECEIEVKT